MANHSHSEQDVIVAGGGTAGIGAALAAARGGARTLLIENGGYLGGELVTGLALLTFHAPNGEQHIWGIPQELVDRALEMGATPGHLDVPDGHIRTVTYIDPEAFKLLANRLLQEAGARTLFHSMVTDVLVDGSGMHGVVVHNKSGRHVYLADVVIDATGDADLVAQTDAPMETGRAADGLQMAMTLMFRMGNVDLSRIPVELADGRTYGVKPGDTKPSLVRVQGLLRPWAEALEVLDLFPDGGDHLIAINSLWDSECNVNTSRLVRLDGTSAEDLSRAEMEAREQVMRIVAFLRAHVPGFEHSHLIMTAPRVGKRETRRIVGDYVLTKDDVLGCAQFYDCIARSPYPMDMHDPEGRGIFFTHAESHGSCEIPYRCLLPQHVQGLLVAGRCMSVSHEALAATRVTATGMACGQAAGTAAALSVESGTAPRDLDVELLQERLMSTGAWLRNEWMRDSPIWSRFEADLAMRREPPRQEPA